jgi:hypothetical protein
VGRRRKFTNEDFEKKGKLLLKAHAKFNRSLFSSNFNNNKE